MCSEYYVRCVRKYVCTYDKYSQHLMECGRNLAGALRAVVAYEKCRLSKYVHKL